MLLNTKVEYAIRALTELALVTGKKPVTIKEICNRQNLPIKYMEQLFRKLKHSNIVKSYKGASGGYTLNFSPDELTLSEVMAAVEDTPVRLDCSGSKGYREFCIGQPCPFYQVWKKIEDDLNHYFEGIKLSRFLTLKSLSGGNNGR